MTLTETLETLSSKIEALIKPPLTILEIVDIAKSLGDVILEFNPNGTESEQLALLREAWDWAEGKYQLVEKADAALKLPFYLEPFDGPAIAWLVPNVVLPPIARLITKKS